MKYTVLTICFCLLVVPKIVSADIVLSEIAWMGSTESANDEWIELFNTSSADVSVDGWILTDGNNFSIELSGTIGAKKYVVLERTDEDSAPGTAFLIYTGALSNGGATLTLLDSSSRSVDVVVGGEGWELIGGDNESKETPQLIEGSWVTDDATPGSSPDTLEAAPEVFLEDAVLATPSTSKEKSRGGKSQSFVLPDHTLSVSIDAPSTAYVGQKVSFAMEAAGISSVHIDSLQYDWNFGDLATAEGKEVTHMFRDPGNYVVVGAAEYKRHSATARHEIVVLPTTLTLSRAGNRDVYIHNDARYEVDASEFVLVGDVRYVLPGHTVFLPGATVRVPKGMIEPEGERLVILYDLSGSEVARLVPAIFENKNKNLDSDVDLLSVSRDVSPELSEREDPIEPSTQTRGSVIELGAANVAGANSDLMPVYMTGFGIIGLFLISVAALWVRAPEETFDE